MGYARLGVGEETGGEEGYELKLTNCTILLVVALSMANIEWAKKPKKNLKTQDAMMVWCESVHAGKGNGAVSVVAIRSHRLSVFSGIGAPPAGIEATIMNGCAMPVTVSLSIGYFDGRGVQFGSGIALQLVGAYAHYELFHSADLDLAGLQTGAVRLVRILSINAFPLQ